MLIFNIMRKSGHKLIENEPNFKAIIVKNFKFYFDTKFFNEKDFQPIIQEKLNELKIENPKTFKGILENPNNFIFNNEDDSPFFLPLGKPKKRGTVGPIFLHIHFFIRSIGTKLIFIIYSI